MTPIRIQPANALVRTRASTSPSNQNPKPAVFRPHPGILDALVLCLAFCLPAWAGAQSVTLEWNGVSSTNVAGYYLHYGAASHNYTFRIDAGTNTTIAAQGLASGGTYYFCTTAYDLHGNESLPSNEASFPVPSNVPPVITSQPTSRTSVAGTTATFTVGADGTAPLSYQWLEHNLPIAGGNLATLTLTNVADATQGSYSVVVSNWAGVVTSSSATLTVLDPPVIVTAPVSETNLVGGISGFSVFASGMPPLTYQWLENAAPVPGATNSYLILANLGSSSAGSFAVIVSNPEGSVTSSPAVLTITGITKSVAHSAPSASKNPANPGPAPGNTRFAVPSLWIIPGVKAKDPMTIRVSLVPAYSYELQSTEDFRSWTTLEATGVMVENGWIEFQDNTAGASGARFYRVVAH